MSFNSQELLHGEIAEDTFAGAMFVAWRADEEFVGDSVKHVQHLLLLNRVHLGGQK